MKWTTLALSVPLLTACGGPLSSLNPASHMARQIAHVWWGMFAFATLVLVAVSAIWIYALARKPRQTSKEQAVRINRRWVIGGGIVLPSLSIVVLLIFGIPTGRSMMPLPVEGQQPLKIEVTGHQWWWEVYYPDSGVTTANQLIIPAGRLIDVNVTSADVIHSFWIPRLGGKMDMIPGRTNVIRLQAGHTGVFHGQCSEFCGLQHAHMKLHVEALDDAGFDNWIAARENLSFTQRAPGEAGQVFDERCGQCHRVAGITNGSRAPDLSDLATRPSLGAGVIDNDHDGLRQWLREHKTLKFGNGMPAHDDVPPQTLDQIADWLETLAP
ncbi:heme/copper-type cytochrome/quinol oxidasesubunit 2 [Pseudomonas sp. MT-1]|nr:heme/copper-type cytochrome/quinol oxidasesubunit 2 [Pseudomonas sp. MT-1]